MIAAIGFAAPAGAQAATLNVCNSGCAYSSIQSAVNAASAGDTVWVAAGIYAESVTIPAGKDGLMITGAEAGIAPDQGGPVARPAGESVLDPSGIAFVVSSNSVTIDGFTIRDGSIGVEQFATVSGLRALDTTFSDEGNAVVADGNGTNTTLISHDAFWDSSASAPFGVGDAIISGNTAGNLTVEHDLFAGDTHAALHLLGARASGVTVSDNTVQADGNVSAGGLVALWGDDDVSITGNSVSGTTTYAGIYFNDSRHVDVERNRLTDDGPPAPAIWVDGWAGAENQDVHILYNDLSANTAPDVYVSDHATLGTLEVHFNRLEGHGPGSGLASFSLEPVDASDNWWGCNAGPGQSGCSSTAVGAASAVTTSPCLVLGLSGPSGTQPGGAVTVKADLLHDSAGNTVGGMSLPSDPVSFTATAGALNSASVPLSQGIAQDVLSDDGSSGADVTAALDGQRVSAHVAFLPWAAGVWSPDATMGEVRAAETATLLPDGKVLVAGGVGSNGAALATAEVYDPVTNRWSSAGSMNTPRESDTATLLPDGKVLVVGGLNGSAPLQSAELYDPASSSWSAAASPLAPVYLQTATLLPDGTVLIAGGVTPGTTGAAEIYHPGTDSWSWTGSMSHARWAHTATLLQNGKVLVAGGNGSSGLLATAEVYDPGTGTWSPTGSMSVSRLGGAAVLLPNGKVLVAGGSSNNGSVASAELYDPASGAWSQTGSMSIPRESGTAALLPDGRVLIAGGANGYVPLASAELYDPATGMWSGTADLKQAVVSQTMTSLPDGRVLLAGGAGSNSGSSSSELFAVTTTTVSPAGDFGSVTSGQDSPVVYLPVTNAGDHTLFITGESLAGADAGDFTVASDGCAGKVVQSGASCRLGVRFSPSGTGRRTATIT
ncbi:MAG TPA: kelch repeat-containing protein, partial [Solirubrobacteraceae bacterium]|nr:kelch repeat-containing protein [Solirubrobacteraceae bacterium]